MKMSTFIGRIRIGTIHRRFAGIFIELALTLEVGFWRVFAADDADIVLQTHGVSAVRTFFQSIEQVVYLMLAVA
ncbi:hypothetical protein AGMMS50256_05830 [Betaproteobacteria bacterium]|nr:hypothetical protein AGMMS50256_05830 [Betaproteobacteria bacterium]